MGGHQPYSDIDPRSIRSDAPVMSNHLNEDAYKAHADDVLDKVKALTDRQKMVAEYYDNKARGTIFSPPLKMLDSPRDFYQLDFLLHFAEFDAGIVAWQEKARHDAVRPVTAIQYLYGDTMVPMHDDKDPDTPDMVPASQWEPYLYTSNHPEYPSATACFCAAEAQAWKRYNADRYDTVGDEIPVVNGKPGFSGVLKAGSSIHEPGITPSSDVPLVYATWTDYVRECADSRVWTGVHFQAAVDASIEICTDIGDATYDYFLTLLDGTAPPRGPDQKLSPDTGGILVCR